MPISLFSHDRVGLCSDNATVALEHVDVHADLRGSLARVTCTQRYRNQESRPIEAVYVFPLDESAAVCGFAAVVGGVRYEGVVKTREAAFASYDDAMADGHGAFLLDEERPDVFTASIGNLAPGAEVQIELTYVTELPYEGESIRFTLPTTVSPRYAPSGDRTGVGRPAADVLNPPQMKGTPYGLSFVAHVATPGRARRIESPSHPIAVDLDGDRAVVTLAQQHVELDRDLVLLVTPSEAASPQVMLELTSAGKVAAAITFRPTFNATAVPADVVFLLDRSGSMQGASIEQVRNAMQLCLRSLQSGCRFDIVGFGSRFESLFGECRPYDEHTLDQASRYVASLEASLGGTEILPALEAILEQGGRREQMLQLVVLTDGQVTNTDDVIDLVRRHARRVRVFTFGIGRSASHHLVKGLARAGGGTSEFVYPGERLEAKVVRLFRRALSPALTDVHLDWGRTAVTPVLTTVGPIFADEPLRAYAWIDDYAARTVTLRARSGDGPVSWSLDLKPIEAVDGATVGTLAARARIRELEEGGAWSLDRGSRQLERRQDRVVNEIVRLATEYGLSSRETSWVAVAPREVPLAEEPVLRRVPITIASGWGGRDDDMDMGATGSFDLSQPSELRAMFVQDARVVVARASMAPAAGSPPKQSRPPGGGWFDRFRRGRSTPSRIEPILARIPQPTRVLDRLVALQRADGSWDLDQALAEVLGASLADLVARVKGASGDPDEARRAWATALALAFLSREASANRGEWELLAAKGRRWLDGVKAVPPGGGSWTELAEKAHARSIGT